MYTILYQYIWEFLGKCDMFEGKCPFVKCMNNRIRKVIKRGKED